MYVCIYSRWGVSVPYFDGDKTMLGGLCFFNYFVTPFSTSKFWMKTSKHWAINSSFHTISCVLAKPKLVRAIDNLVYTSPWDMNGLGKTKTKWRGRERIGAFFFLFLAFRGGHAVKRRGKQNTISNKVQESNHWPNYFCISVWQIEFWTGMSSPSSHPAMSCTYTHFSCCSFIFLFCFAFFLK